MKESMGERKRKDHQRRSSARRRESEKTVLSLVSM